jgi:hypothetical protein
LPFACLLLEILRLKKIILDYLMSTEEIAINRYNNYASDISKIQISEYLEGSSEEAQIKYFINFLITNPEIKVILEIGFNTGVSSAYFLSSREDIHVISVDIGTHKYVNDCKKIIDAHFPGRHTLLIGDSKVVIPSLGKLQNKISPDLIYIDGDHVEPAPLIDARNCIALARPDTILVMDDTNLINGWNGVLQGMCTLVQNKEIDLNWVVCEQFGKHSWTLFKKAPKY